MGLWRDVVSSAAASGAELRSKTNLVYITTVRERMTIAFHKVSDSVQDLKRGQVTVSILK